MTAEELRLPKGEISDMVIAARGRLLAALPSPIERMLLAAICRTEAERQILAAHSSTLFLFGSKHMHKLLDRPVKEVTRGFLGVHLFMSPQVSIGTYRCDFVAIQTFAEWVNEGTPDARLICSKCSPIVIECDGHDFHERTKEQAEHDRARDRFMQEQGFVVLRFTGSEIYRDSMSCASQIFAFADKQRAGK